MPERDLYLAAYDIAEPRRMAAMLDLVRGHATGGQKSAYEIFLTPAEKSALLHQVALIIDEGTDRFFLLRLDPRARYHALGVGSAPQDPPFFYVG